MEYFILEVSKEYMPPSLENWFGKLDRRLIYNKKFYEFPKHMFFCLKKHMQMVFTDILLHPCFMVSNEAKRVIQLYDPSIKFVRIQLFDRRKRKSKSYYIPYLKGIDCLGEKSKLNLDRSVIFHAQIEGNKIGDKPIVYIANVNTTCIVVRQDLVESLLRRRLIGIGLRETDTVYI